MLPENWQAMELFLACSTQWRHAPMGGVTGLDYPAVHAVMQIRRIPADEQYERLMQIQRIERGALSEMGKQRGQ